MLSVALIVFREVLEAALLIGVVFAATRGVAARGWWIVVGIGAGTLGAIAVAGSAEQLAAAAQGMGQELFNASVLLAAVLMLSWHTLWMSTHGREMVTTSRSLSQDINRGARPLYALAVVVGLAVLREGSEIVLFLAGLLAAGTTNSGGILMGGLIGLVGGASIGGGISLGLLKIPARHLFTVTGWWIALLAAGMAAQAVAFLVQAGFISAFTETAWNTSSLVTDGSIVGQTLHALVGYIAAPMVIQVITYGFTAALLGGMLVKNSVRDSQYSRPKPIVSSPPAAAYAIAAILGCATSPQARAEDFKVYSPYIEQGEWEFEFRGNRTISGGDAHDNAQDYVYEFSYAPTTHWYTALFLETEREPGAEGDLNPSEFAWENIYQLTEPGEYWLDLAAYVEYSKGLAHGGDHALEWKVLAEKTIGRWTFTANPIFVQAFPGREDTPGVEFKYAWSTHYRLRPEFEPGFEAFGGVGELTHADPLSEQQHLIGPDVQGKFNLGKSSKLVYDIGYLFGLTDAAPDGAIKFELEYEVRF